MEEFDKHDVNTVLHLDKLAAEQWRQTPGLRALETEEPRPSTEDTHKFREDDDNDDDGDENDDEENEDEQQQEPSLFDILQDDAEDELDEDLPSDQQE